MDLNTFNLLEKKIEELLGRLSELSGENGELRGRLEEKDKELAEMNQLLAEGDAERDQVRKRVEQLLAKLETL
ncbi:MAG: cell division protein ZapB [Desulfarculaceae bacterium]|nr:cell division protein ZapB [Desulfarculaceae bacterium]